MPASTKASESSSSQRISQLLQALEQTERQILAFTGSTSKHTVKLEVSTATGSKISVSWIGKRINSPELLRIEGLDQSGRPARVLSFDPSGFQFVMTRILKSQQKVRLVGFV